jgi:hypothetical protein
MKIATAVLVCTLGASTMLSGCLTTPEGKGAVIGGAAGTAVGAIASGTVGGAIVGGAVGAGAGYLIGRHTYRCERVNMFGQKYLGTCWR